MHRIKFWIAFGLLFCVSMAAAQTDCPTLVQTALDTAASACEATGRNEVCYGNVLLSAEPQADAADFRFETAGDVAALGDIQTLALTGLDEAAGTWGVALMRVQANIPDTLPGQNVTFVLFGDVEVQNAVPANPVLLDVSSAGGEINIRSNPNAGSRIALRLEEGQTLRADGRLEDGSWLRVQIENEDADSGEANLVAGWVSADVVTLSGDAASLPVVDAGDTTITSGFSPMQAFYFRSGVGDAPCAEAPDSGILIQTPEGVEQVNLRVNGVDVQLGSTAYLTAEPGAEMTIATLEGAARVQADGVTQIAVEGSMVSVPLDANGEAAGAPEPPEPYDPDPLAVLPLGLLEREVVAAAPADDTTLRTVGSGDLQLTLTWDNSADMDLSVLEPDGSLISFVNTVGASGAQLDVDSNYPCGSNQYSTENIYWPEGASVGGTYIVGVNQFSTCSGGSANWTLTVLVGGEVAFTEQGIGGTVSFTFDYDPATGVDLASLETTSGLPEEIGGGFGFGIGSEGSLDQYDAPTNEGVLVSGDVIDSSFGIGEYDRWMFDGGAGEVWTFAITFAEFDTYLELYDPNGAQITFDDDGGDGLLSLIEDFELPEDGVYTLVVRSFFDGEGGTYTLEVSGG